MKKIFSSVFLFMLISINIFAARITPLLKASLSARKRGKTPLVKLSASAKQGGMIPIVFKYKKGYAPAIKGIQTIAGDVATALVTENEIKELEKNENIITIGAAIILNPLLDISVPATKADMLRYGTAPVYDDSSIVGNGVVIGIVDTGIDWSMDDFKDPITGQTRIAFLWDQTNDSTGTHPSGYTYGAEWDSSQINTGQCDEVDDPDEVCHGTHVAGIAAGNGASTCASQPPYRYVGMAPKATIVFVKTNLQDNGIIDGVNYIFQKAAILGMPASINLSLGGNTGPHDGTTLMEQALNNLTGPGKIIAAAAGNSGADSIHSTLIVPNGEDGDIHFNTESAMMALLGGVFPGFIDIWHSGDDTFTIELISPDTMGGNDPTQGATVYGPVSANDSAVGSTPGGYGSVTVYGDMYDPDNGMKEMAILLEPSSLDFLFGGYSGTWEIVIHGTHSTLDTVHFWSAIGYSASMYENVDFNMTIAAPATADSIISVAAYATKKQWTDENGNTENYSGLTSGMWDPTIDDIAMFSSAGPRRDGVIKPDIAAPGFGVASTRATNATMNPITGGSDIEKATVEDSSHIIMQGTSQACPHVAGAIALILELNPNFSPSQVRDLLMNNAIVDGFTGAVPNNRWGYGKMDIYSALAPQLGIYKKSSIKRMEIEPHFYMKGDVLYLKGIEKNVPIHILNMAGRRVDTGKIGAEGIYIGNLCNGIYFASVVYKGKNYNTKLIIIH